LSDKGKIFAPGRWILMLGGDLNASMDYRKRSIVLWYLPRQD